MFQKGIVIFAIFGIYSVAADDHGCATADKITSMNSVVGDLTAAFLPILMNSSLTDDQRNMMILNEVCNGTEVRPKVTQIETEIAGCPSLIQQTTVSTISLGPLSFLNLFQDFTNVDNFCGCVPSLMQAMAMNDSAIASQLMMSGENDKYPLINVAVMCDNMAIKKAVMMVAESRPTCPNLYKYADILNADNVVAMNSFRADKCPNFDNTKFMCAVDASATMDFKDCITDAETASTTKEKRCGRYTCAMNMTSTCGAGRTWYMHAVNMEKTTGEPFVLDASDCDTSDVTLVTASLGLIMALIFALYAF